MAEGYNIFKYGAPDSHALAVSDTKSQAGKPGSMSDNLPYWLTSTDATGAQRAHPGVTSLIDLLRNPGQTDRGLLNESLAANARNTGQAQNNATSSIARSGFGGSGLNQALQAAIGQAGNQNATNLRSQEARRREDLKREDLEMLYRFFIGPEVSTYGANKGVSVAESQAKSQKQGATIGALASLVGAGIAACHTADELYGVGSDEAALARVYMAALSEDETLRVYGDEGGSKRLAAAVAADPGLRREVRPIFDRFVAEARSAVAG